MITTEVRFSYLNCFEPKENPSGKMKYSASILIPKNDEVGVNEIKAAINAAVQKGIDGNKFTKAHADSGALRIPLRDGDKEFESGDRGPEYRGHFFLNAASDNKPGIVDKNAKPLFDPDVFYSGCYGRADLGFYPYNQAGNKGVGVGLNNLMFTREGDRLDGRQRAEDAFAAYASKTEDGMNEEVSGPAGDLE